MRYFSFSLLFIFSFFSTALKADFLVTWDYEYQDGLRVYGLDDQSIENLIIPDSLEYNGIIMPVYSLNTFSNYENIKSIVIPKTVRKILNFTFDGCTSLECVTFADGDTDLEIGAYVFNECPIKKIIVGRDITKYPYASYEIPLVSFVKEMIITPAVQNISQMLLWNRIEKLTIEDDSNSIRTESCISADTVYLGRNIYPNGNNMSSSFALPYKFEFGPHVNQIYTYTFLHKGRHLTIPSHISLIYSHAFDKCGFSLLRIAPSDEPIYFKTQDSFYRADIDSLIIERKYIYQDGKNGCFNYHSYYYQTNTALKYLYLGDDIDSLPQAEFCDCPWLSYIRLSSYMTTIEPKTFYRSGYNQASHNKIGLILEPSPVLEKIGSYSFYQTGIYDLDLSNTSLITIDYNAFSNSYIKRIHLPRTMSEFGSESFAYCDSLRDFIIENEEVPQILDNVFYFTPIWKCTLHVPSNSVEKYKAHSVWKKFKSIIPIEPSSIDNVTIDSNCNNHQYFNLFGQKTTSTDQIVIDKANNKILIRK